MERNAFDVVVVDPPWAYGRDTGRTRTAEHHYKTIGAESGGEINRKTGAGIERIINTTPIGEWARLDSHLYLWTTNPKLPFAFPVMSAWGFEYKTCLTWVKTTKDSRPIQNGMGWFFRGITEHILFGVRGSRPIPAALRRPNYVETALTDEEEEAFMLGHTFPAMRGAHSEKPAAFYELVETVSPDAARLDVYARKARIGWEVWGDEVPHEKRTTMETSSP